MNDEYIAETYPPELLPYLYPELYPDYWFPPDSTTDPVQEPAPGVIDMPPPEEAPAASDPIEVISVDDLLNILQPAGQEPVEELPTGELPADEAFFDPGEVLAIELDPGALAVVDAIKGVKAELIQISDQVAAIQLSMDDKPLLTTPFEDYTVAEGLLLFLLLAAFVAACAKMLKEGLSWLRS